MQSLVRFLSALPLAALLAAQGQTNDSLVRALRQGGYVIVMRHASSPAEVPDAKTANADNPKHERQLDERGRASAEAMGKALRELKIPIGEIFSSPTCRALETVRLMQLGRPTSVPELGDSGRSMQASTEAQSAWLRKRVEEFPAGNNTLIVTHSPNMTRAFSEFTRDLTDGEALIFGPDSKGGAALVTRVKIDEWPRMAQ